MGKKQANAENAHNDRRLLFFNLRPHQNHHAADELGKSKYNKAVSWHSLAGWLSMIRLTV
jgi:hypothetical protein